MEPHFYSHAQERNEEGSCVLAHAERLMKILLGFLLGNLP